MSSRTVGRWDPRVWWPVPTVRLALVLAATSVAVLLLPEAGRWSLLGVGIDRRFLLVNAVVWVVALIDLAAAPSPGSVQVRRLHPAAVTLGHEAMIEWVLTRPTVDGTERRLSALGSRERLWLADDLAPSLGAERRRVTVRVPKGAEVTVGVRIRPTRRGRFRPSEIVIRSSGPLGLVLRQRRRSVPTSLRVLPQFRSARQAELSLRRARGFEVGLRSARGRGGGTEFESLRELTPDDETRRVDWAATARSTRPIVRTYRAEQNQTVLCLLDVGRVMAAQVEGAPRLEHGMDGAMLLAELATGLGDRMGLIAFDRTVHTSLEPSNRRSQRSAVAEAVFDLEPALAESDYRSMVSHVVARHRRRCLLVLVTEPVEEVAVGLLMPVLPLLTRTHLVVVASIRDPRIDRWAEGRSTGGPDIVEDGFRRAAAIAELDSRRRVTALLRTRGVLVVDATPEAFAAALGDVYLEAKAVGRL